MKNLKNGGFCRWLLAGVLARGMVEALRLPSAADRARVRVYAAHLDGFIPTEERVDVPVAELVSTLELRAPTASTSAIIEQVRLAATQLRAAAIAGRGGGAFPLAPADHPAHRAPLTVRYTDPDGLGWIGYIESESKDYIAFIAREGFGLLWASRAPDGGPVGEPMKLERDLATLEPGRGWARDLGPAAVHTDGTTKIVRHGVEFTIDRPVGHVKRGVDENGAAYETAYTCNYGYVAGTRGGDKQPIDAYVGDDDDVREVHIINQVRSDGSDDEQKIMVAHKTMGDAVNVYHAHTPARYFGAAFSMPVREFKRQLRAAQRTPEEPFRFTHAAMPVQPGEPPEPPSKRGDQTGGGRGGAGRSMLDLQRLLDAASGAASATDTLFSRAATAAEGGIREADREVDCVMSDERVDSYGTILRASNWDLQRFLANPVLLWAHNLRDMLPPVGIVVNPHVDQAMRALVGTARFDVGEFDELIFQKYVRRVQRAFSVGFNPREARIEVIDGEEVIVFDDIELTELSCVPVPGNAGALAGGAARQRIMQMTRSAGGRLVIAEGFRAALDRDPRSRVFVPGQVRADEMTCAICKTASEDPEAVCCAGCGAALKEMACPRCMGRNLPGNICCSACGTRLAGAPTAPIVREDELMVGFERGVVPFQDTPVVDIAWDGAAARETLQKWASSDGSGNPDKIDRKKLARGFAYVKADDAALSAFMFPHHTVRDDKLVCVREALSATVGALNGDHGAKVEIPASDLLALKSIIARHYKKAGEPSPWDEKRTNPTSGEQPMPLKRLEKSTIRQLGDGTSCSAACAHCNGEIEVAHADLPANPTLVREMQTLKDGHASALGVITAEKTAAETRATTLEGDVRLLSGELVRFMGELVDRDLTSLAGRKIDAAEVETERDLALTYIRSGMKRVPVDATKAAPTDPHEYEGLLKWRGRVAKLEGRNDIGLLGRSITLARPEGPRAPVDATRINNQPPGGPPVNTGMQIVNDGERRSTVAGGGLASLVGKRADRPEPGLVDPSRDQG